jgi:hypothetical protein
MAKPPAPALSVKEWHAQAADANVPHPQPHEDPTHVQDFTDSLLASRGLKDAPLNASD